MISSFILFIFEIIYISLYPYKYLNGVSLILGFNIMRLLFSLICSGFGIFMLIVRIKGSNSHKYEPVIIVEKVLSVVCLVFSICVIISNITGNIVSNSLEKNNNPCMNTCQRYSNLDKNDDNPAYICSHKVLDGEYEKYQSNYQWEKPSKYYDCEDVYLCFAFSGDELLDVLNHFVTRFKVLLIISIIDGIYWIIMIVCWGFMIKYIYNGNPDYWVQTLGNNNKNTNIVVIKLDNQNTTPNNKNLDNNIQNEINPQPNSDDIEKNI